jgi:AraC family transcriptional regulator of adaptative response/methylated-DNA-[protein]-cysteine methyltransferase
MRPSIPGTQTIQARPTLFGPALPSRQEMERAFFGSDAAYDGIFFTGVRTTGIFCRPSCRARKPLPAHVEFFGSVRDALFAGYRPCRRCHPMHPPGSVPGWVKTLLDAVDAAPERRLRDGDLRRLDVDPVRARRYFLEHYGVTFHAYCRGRRLAGALGQLRRGVDLDDVTWGSGWESASGFRDAFVRMFGTPPGKSVAASCVVTTMLDTPLGSMIAGAVDEGLCLLEFADRRMLEAQIKRLERLLRQPLVAGDQPHLRQARQELDRYFSGALQRFTVPLVLRGTPFEERVWRQLVQIPYGETCSYAELARRVDAPGAQRAVGRANGMNRISIVIPCHRVVNSDGKLGGYGGGLWRKHWLLELEQRGRET